MLFELSILPKFAQNLRYMNQLLVSNIERLRKEKNWSKADLAKAMGVDPASLSRTLSSDLRLSTIEKIASAFEVSVKTLFDDTDRIEGFALVRGKLVHFNTREELDEEIKKAQPVIKLRL